MSGPFVLVPLTITDAMISSSTIAEPAAGEAAWVAETSYAVGQQVIRSTTHKIYENLIAGINATLPELTITDALPRWFEVGPTNRWAAFDGQVNTPSQIATPLTYVMRPGMFNAIALYGLSGATLAVSIKDAPGGTVIYSDTSDLIEPPLDHYDYYFGNIKQLTKKLYKNLVPYADPEVTITITAGVGTVVKAGMIVFGDLRTLVSVEGTGGVQFGASAKPVTYSYISTDAFGRTKIVRRASATDMDIRVVLPRADSDTTLATIQEVLDVPAAWIGSDAPGFTGLNVFGLGSGGLSYEGPEHSVFSIQVKGFI